MTTWTRISWAMSTGAALLALTGCGARTGLPAPDVEVKDDPDAAPDCADVGGTFIYVVTKENQLLSFDPPAAVFSSIGTIDCPDVAGSTPFSMGVDRKGTAYVVFRPDGELYRVSTVNALCKGTSFVPDQHGFSTFGMGFSTNDGGPDETLYVAESNFAGMPSMGLGSIDTKSFELSFLTPFSPALGNAVELTGTGSGRLFGLFIDANLNQASIAEIDKKTGAVTDPAKVPLGAETTSFAFAYWGGDFYVFHAESDGPTIVSRYRPADGSLTDVAQLATHVVGVGVSTCAPEG